MGNVQLHNVRKTLKSRTDWVKKDLPWLFFGLKKTKKAEERSIMMSNTAKEVHH